MHYPERKVVTPLIRDECGRAPRSRAADMAAELFADAAMTHTTR